MYYLMVEYQANFRNGNCHKNQVRGFYQSIQKR